MVEEVTSENRKYWLKRIHTMLDTILGIPNSNRAEIIGPGFEKFNIF